MNKSSLRNLEAVEKMLHGEHRTQTRKSFNFAEANINAEANLRNAESAKRHEVGDYWNEYKADGTVKRVVEQCTGFRTYHPAGWTPEAAKAEYESMFFIYRDCYEDCEKRRTRNYTHIDRKAAIKTGRCLDCLARYETKLRLQGKHVFEKYALDKMKNNALAWLKDTDQEVEQIKIDLRTGLSTVYVDGRTETFNTPNVENMITKIDQDYAKFKTELLENLEYGNDTVGRGRNVELATNPIN